MEAIRPRARLLVTDLDNTLYEWFDIWHSSFSALLEEVATISGLPSEVLERDARNVHQRHRTSEYSFLLNEMECPCECDLALTCPNFLTTSEYTPRLRARLDRGDQLIADAQQRGWQREVERHQATKRRLEQLLHDLA